MYTARSKEGFDSESLALRTYFVVRNSERLEKKTRFGNWISFRLQAKGRKYVLFWIPQKELSRCTCCSCLMNIDVKVVFMKCLRILKDARSLVAVCSPLPYRAVWQRLLRRLSALGPQRHIQIPWCVKHVGRNATTHCSTLTTLRSWFVRLPADMTQLAEESHWASGYGLGISGFEDDPMLG